MLIYIIGFAVSLFVIRSIEKKKYNGMKFFGGAAFAIFFPCLIAGLRAITIGTDVKMYVEPLYKLAYEAADFAAYRQAGYNSWRYMHVYEFEALFSIIIYIVAKVFKSFQVNLFVIELLVIGPVFGALVNIKKKIPTFSICMGMLMFYTMFYNVSLNLMRQSIAMAFILLAFSFLILEKRGWAIFAAVLAFGFHKTALLGLVVYVVYWFIHSNFRLRVNGKSGRDIRLLYGEDKFICLDIHVVLIIVGSVLALLMLGIISELLRNVGLASFARYITGSIRLLPNQLILRLPIFILFLWNWKYFPKKDRRIAFYLCMLVLDLVISQLASITDQSGRIALFFSEYSIISYPLLCLNENTGKYRKWSSIFLVSYVSVFWLYYFVIKGIHATYPYMFYFR